MFEIVTLSLVDRVVKLDSGAHIYKKRKNKHLQKISFCLVSSDSRDIALGPSVSVLFVRLHSEME